MEPLVWMVVGASGVAILIVLRDVAALQAKVPHR